MTTPTSPEQRILEAVTDGLACARCFEPIAVDRPMKPIDEGGQLFACSTICSSMTDEQTLNFIRTLAGR